MRLLANENHPVKSIPRDKARNRLRHSIAEEQPDSFKRK